MAGLYVDASALGRILLAEPDAGAVIEALDGFDTHVSSQMARVELRRLALRERRLADADRLLGGVALVPLDAGLLAAAETVEPAAVATLDALHLVTALRLFAAGALEAILTYDGRLAAGARHHGLAVLAPAPRGDA